MKLKIFSSGSAGNATLIRIKDKKILVDVGISKKDLEYNLALEGLVINDIDFLFITHEHIDHIRSFQAMLKSEKLTIIMSKGTFAYISKCYQNKPMAMKGIAEKLRCNKMILVEKLENDFVYPKLNFECFDVQILPLFHDAIEPIGFIFYEDLKKLTYITDTGYVHTSLNELIKDSDAFILESNHDPELLMASDRPFLLKRRILGNDGHLSNEDSMVILAQCMGKNTKYVFHAHVSQECNLSIVIENTRNDVFKKYNIDSSHVEFKILGLSPTEVYEI